MRTDLSFSRRLKSPALRAGLQASRPSAFSAKKRRATAMRLVTKMSLAAFFLLSSLMGSGQIASDHAAAAAPVSQTETGGKALSNSRSSSYVGDQVCASCHRDQSVSYLQTTHHLTSNLPTKNSILGSFEEPASTLKIQDPAPVIGDPGLTYKMERKDDRFFQTAITGFQGQLQSRTEPIDIVIGSGVRGQSYLYWNGDSLYELPVSYWSDGHQWINSPGYRNGPPNFLRQAIPRCLECHVSYIKPLSLDPATNRYDKSTLLTGISCETCHGPGSAHIAMRQAGVAGTQKLPGSGVVNPATFSRDRQIDLCALCHSGAQQDPLAPAFSYKPGTPLDSYLRPLAVAEDSHPDVHANQVGLLKKSRCFASSGTMTCSTCHQMHAPERPAASYSVQCLGCHKAESCGMAKKLGPKIKSNCIDCHMPLEQTQAIVSQTGDKVIRTTMRTHWIRVYPDENIRSDSELIKHLN
jgi:Cytochrome c554 and c-prime